MFTNKIVNYYWLTASKLHLLTQGVAVMALRGLKVVEMAGLAPTPFAGMMLADFGASVIRVDKPGPALYLDVLARNKRSICVSLKEPAGVDLVKKLCCQADVLIEPYRPGIMEKLGLGPEILCSLNPRLVYARLTGFGQSGPLSSKAGHDNNYLAISGVLSMLGRKGSPPSPPINLLADFAGGGLMCVTGILLALLERATSGKGQVVDNAMSSGVAYISTFLTLSKKMGIWDLGSRGENVLDGGAPFYDIYETLDGEFMSVGAIEPQFYRELLKGLGIEESLVREQQNITQWPAMKKRIAGIFATKTRDEWTTIFADIDACVQPVLSMKEAPKHSHNLHQMTHSYDPEMDEYIPNPSPTLSRTPGQINTFNQPDIGEHTTDILHELKLSDQIIAELLRSGVVIQSELKSKI